MRNLRTVQCLACAALAVTFIPFSTMLGPGEATAVGSHRLTGELRLVGSRAMSGLAQRWASDFAKQHPGVKVSLAMSGSGVAAGALAEGEADLAPLSRELTADEQAILTKAGASPLVVRVGNGGYAQREFGGPIAIYVDARNPLPGLTVSQLGSILTDGGELPHWNDMSPDPMGMPDCRIRPYGVGWSHGTPRFLTARLLHGKAMRTVTQVAKGSAGAVAYGKDRCAMGIGSPSDAPPGTRLLAIGSFDGFVPPTESSVASGAYPLTRGIYLYANAYGDRPVNPNAGAFIRFVLGKHGQDAFAGQPFLPLPAATAKIELSRLEPPGT
jgi:phosphate transport system substrate-binding protein